ncbi:hypothetical protein OESDEN_23415 [Oesophagostomum dentatum]|uniref:Potassium channel domain-containing protein n=2 Tax=Oesophagostomum dentatum TaxID=61180 RepID=A0A0B1S152_OESDE|nr:hypothetical protein OESDEN_23415 [Oesophagostomum dentatum]
MTISAFSFVSITTIGYGDITVTPVDNFGTAIMILYLIGGIIIMSMFVNAMVEYIEWIHYLGRKPTTFLSNIIWFGGESMTVQQLVQLAAASFEIPPRQLRATIKNLDHILALALEGDLRKKSKIMVMYDNLWDRNTFARQNDSKFKDFLKSTTSLSRSSVRSHEKEIMALKVLYDNLGNVSSKSPS